ncbi:glutathione hydrolase 1 proenzyme [Eurytemora carolleeae]|uniref:glutathione hydrolase 1 proenzyme n=1 Tax=Eurytemora carolleeae TaxID=1294199 RepID=UPI000C78DCB4|nr:glutathione hydrolase 1 proenzyme [Eurytemora carolleeae]|eukprot:XP_023326007.1 glutathione hydrolase 1 proenzyme-like [Eurytemora affinis]
MESGVPKWARTLLISLIAAVCAAGIVAGICVGVFSQKISQVGCELSGNCDDYSIPHPIQLSTDAGDATIDEHSIDPAVLPAPSSSLMKKYKLAAVAVDSLECSTVGRNILERGGNAVDAAVATLFCNGVVTSQSMGIGGGFIMTIRTSSLLGPLAAGVPGEVMGLWEAKQRLGNPNIPWSDLIQPSINLCRNGITISAHAANAMNITKSSWKEDPGMRSVFLNSDGNILQEGDVYKHPLLAHTLEQIAQKGGDEFYKGDIAKKLVDDIQKSGGIITMEDMKNYRVSWEAPVTAKIPGTEFTILSSPPPGSGSVMAAILGIAGAYKPNPLDRGDPLLWHRFVEACKFAYAKRTMLGDWQSADVRDLVQGVVSNLTSESWIIDTVNKISDEKTFDSPEHYGADFYNVEVNCYFYSEFAKENNFVKIKGTQHGTIRIDICILMQKHDKL